MCLGLQELPCRTPPAPEMTDEVLDLQVIFMMSSAIKYVTTTGRSLNEKTAVLLTLVTANRAGQWPAILNNWPSSHTHYCYFDQLLSQKFCFTTKCWKNSFKIWQIVAQGFSQWQRHINHHFGMKGWPLRFTVPMWSKHWCCWVSGIIHFLITKLRKETEDCKTQQVGDGVTFNNRRHKVEDVSIWWREKNEELHLGEERTIKFYFQLCYWLVLDQPRNITRNVSL